jgi:FkbM family methyltransferase
MMKQFLPQSWRSALYDVRSDFELHRATGFQLRRLVRSLADLGSPLTMYVVGASGVPDRPQRYLSRCAALRLVGFEPNDAEKSVRPEAKPYYERIVPTALGSAKETRRLHLCRELSCSSFLEPNRATIDRFCTLPQSFDVVGRATVDLERLDALGLSPPDVLQIDTQGFELEVLRGAGDVLNDVLVIDLEAHFYPLYVDQPLIGDLCRFLFERGFVLNHWRDAHGSFRDALIEGDFCFVNTNRRGPRSDAALAVVRARYRFFDARSGK